MGTITVLITSIQPQRDFSGGRGPHRDIGAEHEALREMAAMLRWKQVAGGNEGPSFGWRNARLRSRRRR